MHVSSHGVVRYLRCVCGRWLVEHRGGVSLVTGRNSCATSSVVPEHLELIPLPDS